MSKRKRPAQTLTGESKPAQLNRGAVRRREQSTDLTKEQQVLLGFMHAIEKKGSLEDLLLSVGPPDPEQVAAQLEGFRSQCLSVIGGHYLKQSVLNSKKWEDLASRPKDFDRELRAVLSSLTRLMKSLYGRQSHRPATHRSRNRKIWQLRQGGLTFGQIAKKLRTDAKTAERACNRHEQYREAQTEDVLKMLSDLLVESGPPFSKSPAPYFLGSPPPPYLM
ncbi:MAG: hypothetical protein O2968_22845 [Acidobacteria bacterium]|nr:hypothetical protein [Acidobacteriota bacterium]